MSVRSPADGADAQLYPQAEPNLGRFTGLVVAVVCAIRSLFLDGVFG